MKVVLSSRARQSLMEIGDYIAADNPRRAYTFIEILESKALQIGNSPRAYPVVVRQATLAIRRRAYRNYLIFYRIDDTQVTIMDIIHAARDYDRLLAPPA